METVDAVRNERYGIPKYAGQSMTRSAFLSWESDDNFVYEFHDGILEPTTGMRQDEHYLFSNLETAFLPTEAFSKGGRLRAEMEIWISEKQMRRPDIAYFSADQIRFMTKGEQVIPGFVVELASETDNELRSITKLHDYFDAGVQVVWWVYPVFKEVYVYTSPKIVTICTDNDILSATPVLPELQITVNGLFDR